MSSSASTSSNFFSSYQSQSSSNVDIAYSPFSIASSTSSSLSSFFGHVFDSSFQGKVETMNLLQYGFVGGVMLLPFMAAIEMVVPAVNFHTSSPLLLFEIIMHLLLLFLAFLFVHRITTYIPTLSGVQYEKMSYIHAILPFLMIIGTIHTKIAAKLIILLDRFRAKMGVKARERITGIGKYPTISSIFGSSSSPPTAIAGVGTVSSDPAPFVHNTTSSGSAGPIALAHLPGGSSAASSSASSPASGSAFKKGPVPAAQLLGLKF